MQFQAFRRSLSSRCGRGLTLVSGAVLLWSLGCGGGSSSPDEGSGGSDQSVGGAGGASSGDEGGTLQPQSGGSGGGGIAGMATGGSSAAASGGAGGSAGIAGAAGMGAGGTPGTGGTASMSDKAKEKVWFDGNINLGSMSATTTAPPNWFAPVNYYDGQILVRLVVTKGITQSAAIEICMSKTGGNDPKHTCPTLINNIMGEGEFTKKNLNAGGLLLNGLAQATMVKADFETPFATSDFHLIKVHGTPLVGPVIGKLTMVLVPKGLTFSGWAGYPN